MNLHGYNHFSHAIIIDRSRTTYPDVVAAIKADVTRRIIHEIRHRPVVEFNSGGPSYTRPGFVECQYTVQRLWDGRSGLCFADDIIEIHPSWTMSQIYDCVCDGVRAVINRDFIEHDEPIFNYIIEDGLAWFGAYNAAVYMQWAAKHLGLHKDIAQFVLCPMIWASRNDACWDGTNKKIFAPHRTN
jgi:hypothetical protein